MNLLYIMTQLQFDEAFQFCVEVFGFSNSLKYCDSWISRIYQIDVYWNKMLDSFNRSEFKQLFEKYCLESLNTPGKEYDIEKAFKKAKEEWKVDLMTNVANEIAFGKIPTKSHRDVIVKWSGNMMIIDWSVLKRV